MPSRDLAKQPIRVLIVEDDLLFGATLSAFLDADERLEVVGLSATLRAAIADTASHDAEVVIVDVYLGSELGFGIVSALRDLNPRLAILMMSALDAEDFEAQALAAGASGILPKGDFVVRGRECVVAAGLASVDVLPQPPAS